MEKLLNAQLSKINVPATNFQSLVAGDATLLTTLQAAYQDAGR